VVCPEEKFVREDLVRSRGVGLSRNETSLGGWNAAGALPGDGLYGFHVGPVR
jgi:hypothetical protein